MDPLTRHAVIGLILALSLFPTHAEAAATVRSDHLEITYEDNNIDFFVNFLAHNVSVGNNMTWKYAKFISSMGKDVKVEFNPFGSQITSLLISEERNFTRIEHNVTMVPHSNPAIDCVSAVNFFMKEPSTFEFAEEKHDVPSGCVKSFLEIRDWPFETYLYVRADIEIQLSLSDIQDNIELHFATPGDVDSNLKSIVIKGSTQTWTVAMGQNFIRNNGTNEITLPVTNIHYNKANCSNPQNCRFIISLFFPRCEVGSTSCIIQYDPDISVPLGSKPTSNGNDSDDELMIILVSILVPGAFLIVLGVIIVVGAIALFGYIQRLRNQGLGQVNFTDE